jgi:hypothetical protein
MDIVISILALAFVAVLLYCSMDAAEVKLKGFVITTLRIEPDPAIKATLYLTLLVGLIVLEIILPSWVIAAIILPLSLGALWWLFYIAFRDLERLHAKTIEAREAAPREARREMDQLKQESQ